MVFACRVCVLLLLPRARAVCLKRMGEFSKSLGGLKEEDAIHNGIRKACKTFTDKADKRFVRHTHAHTRTRTEERHRSSSHVTHRRTSRSGPVPAHHCDPPSMRLDRSFRCVVLLFASFSGRQCYYIGGSEDSATSLLRTISQPLRSHMPSEKICERLKGMDQQICEVKYEKPKEDVDLATVDFDKMRVKELKQTLTQWSVQANRRLRSLRRARVTRRSRIYSLCCVVQGREVRRLHREGRLPPSDQECAAQADRRAAGTQGGRGAQGRGQEGSLKEVIQRTHAKQAPVRAGQREDQWNRLRAMDTS